MAALPSKTIAPLEPDPLGFYGIVNKFQIGPFLKREPKDQVELFYLMLRCAMQDRNLYAPYYLQYMLSQKPTILTEYCKAYVTTDSKESFEAQSQFLKDLNDYIDKIPNQALPMRWLYASLAIISCKTCTKYKEKNLHFEKLKTYINDAPNASIFLLEQGSIISDKLLEHLMANPDLYFSLHIRNIESIWKNEQWKKKQSKIETLLQKTHELSASESSKGLKIKPGFTEFTLYNYYVPDGSRSGHKDPFYAYYLLVQSAYLGCLEAQDLLSCTEFSFRSLNGRYTAPHTFSARGHESYSDQWLVIASHHGCQAAQLLYSEKVQQHPSKAIPLLEALLAQGYTGKVSHTDLGTAATKLADYYKSKAESLSEEHFATAMATAIKYYRQAIEWSQDYNALVELAHSYHQGIGLSKNNDQALILYRKALNKVDVVSTYNQTGPILSISKISYIKLLQEIIEVCFAIKAQTIAPAMKVQAVRKAYFKDKDDTISDSVAKILILLKGDTTISALQQQAIKAVCYNDLACLYHSQYYSQEPKEHRTLSLAAKNFALAAGLNRIDAMYNYGVMLINGLGGVVKNMEDGITQLIKSATGNHIPAIRLLCTIWINRGTESTKPFYGLEYSMVEEYFKKLTETLDLKTHHLHALGCLIYSTTDPAKTLAHAQSGAAVGCASSTYFLGTFYETGAPDLHVPQDTKRMLECYQIAADASITKAQYRLGYVQYEGMPGLPKDYASAERQYTQALKGGYAPAGIALLVMYSQGKSITPTPVRLTEILEHVHKLEDRLGTEDQCQLGQYYQSIGNLGKALEHYTKAADRGSQKALYARANLNLNTCLGKFGIEQTDAAFIEKHESELKAILSDLENSDDMDRQRIRPIFLASMLRLLLGSETLTTIQAQFLKQFPTTPKPILIDAVLQYCDIVEGPTETLIADIIQLLTNLDAFREKLRALRAQKEHATRAHRTETKQSAEVAGAALSAPSSTRFHAKVDKIQRQLNTLLDPTQKPTSDALVGVAHQLSLIPELGLTMQLQPATGGGSGFKLFMYSDAAPMRQPILYQHNVHRGGSRDRTLDPGRTKDVRYGAEMIKQVLSNAITGAPASPPETAGAAASPPASVAKRESKAKAGSKHPGKHK